MALLSFLDGLSKLHEMRQLQLVFLVNFDYRMIMQTVRIADLRSRLSEYLHHVRRGRTFTVLDRHTHNRADCALWRAKSLTQCPDSAPGGSDIASDPLTAPPQTATGYRQLPFAGAQA